MSDIDFYFDFLSPYAYFATREIDAVAARYGRKVRWRSFRLGVTVVKVMGLRPNLETPLKAPYILRDITRLAQVFDVPFGPAAGLPNPLPPAQLFYGAPEAVRPALAKALFEAHWAQGRNIGEPETLVAIAADHGLTEMQTLAAIASPDTRQALTDQTNKAIERGVFGSPTFVVEGEIFWGVDRLWLLEHFLRQGGRFVSGDEDWAIRSFASVVARTGA